MLASATPNKPRDSLSNSKHAPTLQPLPTTFSLFQQHCSRKVFWCTFMQLKFFLHANYSSSVVICFVDV
ncbi:hypothetical protein ERO13_D05G229350v2 [Gossypium hirsutum]|nr:hypothetical protein ERO13_D05G229350v2 [Gossypium hirsutum]